jgi:hypothetical protein
MPISVTWGTRVINVPKNYLSLITGTLYELDTEQFRLDLKALEDDEAGMPFPDTHEHATEVTVAGVTYARFITIINSYSITFEDGQYSVRLSGSNNNFFDVENGILNQNQVQVIPGNSAGLIKVVSGSGVTQQDKEDIADEVRTELAPELAFIKNRIKINKETGQYTVYDEDDVTPLFTGTISDDGTFKDRIPD